MTSLSTAERGCLAIADISGYTNLLLSTELEHAEDAVNDLLQRVVAALSSAVGGGVAGAPAVWSSLVAAELAPAMPTDAAASATVKNTAQRESRERRTRRRW